MENKMNLKTLFIYVLIATLLLVSPGYCSWVDDWINQKTVSNPASFESQKRGFATAGGVNMRWKQSSDYIATITKPSFSRGCGGIDISAGGFGFMRYEQLVKDLQDIMGASAAAFAFDIAMNTIAEPVAKSMKSLKAIIDRLNQLQLDDCKAQKATVALLKDTTGMGGAAETEAYADFMQSNGVEELWKEITIQGDGKTIEDAGNQFGVNKAALVAGCPTEIRNIFFTPGSLLSNLANEKGIATGYVDLIRALTGDIEISASLDYNYLPACDENTPESTTDFVYGDIYIRDLATNNCNPIPSLLINGQTYASIADYIKFELEGIAQAMLNKTAFNPTQEAFFQTLPAPIFMAMKADIQAWGDSATAANVAGGYVDFASAAYAVAMFNDLYATIGKVLITAETIVKNKKGTETGADQSHCQDKLKEGPYQVLLGMQTIVGGYKRAIDDSYTKKKEFFVVSLQMGRTIIASEDESKKTKKEQLRKKLK
jgi:conjugative transfer pilus assembly protein TraH